MNTKDLYEKVLINKNAIVRNAVAFLLMFVIFAFEGCFNFATLSWDFNVILLPAYWVKVGTKVILFLLVKSLALTVFLPIARKTNKALVDAKTRNETLMKLKGRDFPEYVERVLNPSIKVEAWKKKINKELLKLEKHAKLQDRALYFSDKENEKKYNKYCIKRTQLELELTNEWIYNNINCLNISGYIQIDPSVFDQPVTCEKENKYQLISKTRIAIIAILVTGTISLLISQAIWNAVDISRMEEYDALAIWIGILMDLAFLVWNFFTGVTKAFSTIENQEVLPYINRNRILTEYLGDKTPDGDRYDRMMAAIDKDINKKLGDEPNQEKKVA